MPVSPVGGNVAPGSEPRFGSCAITGSRRFLAPLGVGIRDVFPRVAVHVLLGRPDYGEERDRTESVSGDDRSEEARKSRFVVATLFLELVVQRVDELLKIIGVGL